VTGWAQITQAGVAKLRFDVRTNVRQARSCATVFAAGDDFLHPFLDQVAEFFSSMSGCWLLAVRLCSSVIFGQIRLKSILGGTLRCNLLIEGNGPPWSLTGVRVDIVDSVRSNPTFSALVHAATLMTSPWHDSRLRARRR